MITLDSSTYSLHLNKYSHVQSKIAAEERTLTGDLSRTESGYFVNTYNMTLLCTTTEVTSLRASFGKVTASGTPAANKLDFTDEEGTRWNPASSGGGVVNTGVYFEGKLDPKPLAPTGWTTRNRFTVDITLTAIAKNILS